tara:strand:- start:4030 stop:6102 length:2073 start_codon:yes stop_codon:yes gene_type:complete
MAIKFLADQSINNQLTIEGSSSDPLLRLYQTNNAGGAQIEFTDQTSQLQFGELTFFHSDSMSYGSGAAFSLTSAQGLSILADGKLLFKDGLYLKPSSGTSTTGSQLITSAGAYKIPSIVNAGEDTNQFLVRDSDGNVDFRTGAEVRSDIGAGTGSGTVTGSGTATRVAVWNGTTDLTDSIRIVFGTNTTFFNNTTSTPVQMQNNGGTGTVKFEGSATSNSSNVQITPGTESKPGLNFGMRSGTGAQDTNTGIFSSAADNLEISTGGSERVNFSSSGTKLTTLNALGSAASSFLVNASGVIKTRTASQVRSDIGAGTSDYSGWKLDGDTSGSVVGIGDGDTVDFIGSTGISCVASSGAKLTITNTAPDQTVTLTGSTGITVSGSYPSFTITADNNGTVTGSGTANTLSKWTSSSAIGNSEITDTGSVIKLGKDASSQETLYLDTDNRKVGFRTSTPGSAFDVNGTIRVRNQLNVGNTSEQNLFVDGNGSAGGRYVKMGNYGQGNYFGISTNINQPKYVAAFGSAGKVVEERRIITIKVSGNAFSNLSSTGTTLIPAPGSNSIILPFEILIYKDTGTTGSGWPSSSPNFGAEIGFCQGNALNCNLTNAFDAVWRLPRSLVTRTGTWFWSRSSATLNEVGATTFQLNKPLLLRSATNLTTLPTAAWYIQIRYAQMNYTAGLINNVDINKSTNG